MQVIITAIAFISKFPTPTRGRKLPITKKDSMPTPSENKTNNHNPRTHSGVRAITPLSAASMVDSAEALSRGSLMRRGR